MSESKREVEELYESNSYLHAENARLTNRIIELEASLERLKDKYDMLCWRVSNYEGHGQ